MKIVHWTLQNGSGLNSVSFNMSIAERKLGLDSFVCFTAPTSPGEVAPNTEGIHILTADQAKEADIHVTHSHLPEGIKGKTVFVPHGTPEHCFANAAEQFTYHGYVGGDAFMLSLYRLNRTDVTVTFWYRHQYIWKSLAPKADVRVVPMGVDKAFWSEDIPSRGKWTGNPSLFTCENMHTIKWPLDIVLAYPILMEALPEVVLHMHYIPLGSHRFWYPLLSANGTLYRSYTSGSYFTKDELRNAFKSVDYYLSPVRYGDFNSICLEAKAAGCKVISYKNNEYADFWIDEGDQREIAIQMLKILTGEILPREVTPVASIDDMAVEMVKIYESL
jgi:glycosyltransferase involved in cell wall biosynthesis